MTIPEPISIRNATEHNLRSVSLKIPKNCLILVTGVSGSGKSSLVFDVLYREAEFRYLGSFSAFARQFLGKMKRPDVEQIDGLSPAIAIGQHTWSANPRSTVGTLTGIYDHLRLLFARAGIRDEEVCRKDMSGRHGAKVPAVKDQAPPLSRSLFSFNSPVGACPHCKGLGVEDRLDPELLVSDERKTLREGALVISQPNGYIMYSQVTIDVLDQVCRAEGFNVDIPWKDLTADQKKIVLYGSDIIEIPYGKHPLASRMRWTGITARPRELGYYKGIMPVMENILKRDRNKNILRFVRTTPCRLCEGKRLNSTALSVKVGGRDIASLAALPLYLLTGVLEALDIPDGSKPAAQPVIREIIRQARQIGELGLGHLSLSREAATLSSGETQRMRLAMLSSAGLAGLTYILDEPSAGLHPYEVERLIIVLKRIRDLGNTVIVVEHNHSFIPHADWLIDIGPGPGKHGGEVVLCGNPGDLLKLPAGSIQRSRTLSWFTGQEVPDRPGPKHSSTDRLTIQGVTQHNLSGIDAEFLLHSFNVLTGLSGSGKTTLTHHILAPFLRMKLNGSREAQGRCTGISGWETIRRLIEIDSSPIGRTPRSNPATYTGLFDLIRDLFAALPEAQQKGFTKSHFSFNTRGGRCESCDGAGYRQIGMHFMGNFEIPCETCNGERFDHETLAVLYQGKNIFRVLEMPVEEALEFFRDRPAILRYLKALDLLGLGYLTLGQRSSTLSGGEAQRVKLATELARPEGTHTLYIMDEPTTGLHAADVSNLLKAIRGLVDRGHTVICIDHHPFMVTMADRVTELKGKSGTFPERSEPEWREYHIRDDASENQNASISLRGITMHNLQNIDIDIPHRKITVITGVSGSGKSSLAFDTIFAEARNRFLEHFSPYARSLIGMKEKPDLEAVSGLTAAFALDQSHSPVSPRSTVGTVTGIYDLYRLMFSRIGKKDTGMYDQPGARPLQESESISPPLSSLFSFNHSMGACPACDGLGYRTFCDPQKLITHPEKSVLSGAIDGTKSGKFYGDPFGQYTATIKAVGRHYGTDYAVPWQELTRTDQDRVLYGTGKEIYDVQWEYRRNNRSGTHHFRGSWPGLIALVNGEYLRKHADSRGEKMKAVISQAVCESCFGSRLKQEALEYRVADMDIARLSSLPVAESLHFFTSLPGRLDPTSLQAASVLLSEIIRRLESIGSLGLSYLSIDRSISTLSAGEERRIRLAAQIGSGLTEMTYVLDEPTAGLHARDIHTLMQQIRALGKSGNTVLLVEHDRDVILAADHVIELGPGAGKRGGSVVAQGTPAAIMAHPSSPTGKYLVSGSEQRLAGRRTLKEGIKIAGACIHNLKGFDVEIPLGGIIGIEGVSGSGKSSLVFDVLHASWIEGRPVGCRAASGFEKINSVVASDHHPSFQSPLAVTATFTGVFDAIRLLFARTETARLAGFTRNHFSFLNSHGHCLHCSGLGQIRTSMDFMPDTVSECEHCKGQRYNDEILQIKWNGVSIADVLQLTVTEAIDLFRENASIIRILQQLEHIGLGYLPLGQPLNTLSGGESQRLRLTGEILTPGHGNALFLFDEPSTGLHHQDITMLLQVFGKLAGAGHTLVVIEHDPFILSHCDHRIELGPDGGDAGGYLIK